MYEAIRWIHGQLALALAVATFVYAISGWMIEYLYLFPSARTSYQTLQVDALAGAGGAEDKPAARALARALRDELDVPGRLHEIHRNGSEWTARFSAPSTGTQLRWSDGDAEVQVETRHSSIGGALAGLHFVHGASGGPAYLAFALMVDLVAVAMVVFAITGVTLWWQLKRRRLGLGLATLAASSLATAAWIAQLTWGA